MDNQEEYSVSTRAEFIKLARESCAKNLSSMNRNSKNQTLSKSKELSTKNPFTITGSGLDMPAMTIKTFLIRTICALMLFLTVLLIDKMDIKLKVLNSNIIQESVSSNQGIDDAETFFVSFLEKIMKTDD